MARICVFTGAKTGNNGYASIARETGIAIAQRGHDLVYGGADLGLMGKLVHSYAKHTKGESIGVVPAKYLGFSQVESTRIKTGTIRQRKEIMERRSDAFIGLPGGFGTLDEICEVLSNREGKDHIKPIALINHQGFFYHLLEFLNQIHQQGFGRNVIKRGSIYVTESPYDALDYIEKSLSKI